MMRSSSPSSSRGSSPPMPCLRCWRGRRAPWAPPRRRRGRGSPSGQPHRGGSQSVPSGIADGRHRLLDAALVDVHAPHSGPRTGEHLCGRPSDPASAPVTTALGRRGRVPVHRCRVFHVAPPPSPGGEVTNGCSLAQPTTPQARHSRPAMGPRKVRCRAIDRRRDRGAAFRGCAAPGCSQSRMLGARTRAPTASAAGADRSRRRLPARPRLPAPQSFLSRGTALARPRRARPSPLRPGVGVFADGRCTASRTLPAPR